MMLDHCTEAGYLALGLDLAWPCLANGGGRLGVQLPQLNWLTMIGALSLGLSQAAHLITAGEVTDSHLTNKGPAQ